MNISNLSNYVPSIFNHVPKVRLASPEQALKNITKIAVPALALVAASMIYEAEAITHNECHDNCDRHRDAHPLAVIICYVACMIFARD